MTVRSLYSLNVCYYTSVCQYQLSQRSLIRRRGCNLFRPPVLRFAVAKVLLFFRTTKLYRKFLFANTLTLSSSSSPRSSRLLRTPSLGFASAKVVHFLPQFQITAQIPATLARGYIIYRGAVTMTRGAHHSAEQKPSTESARAHSYC